MDDPFNVAITPRLERKVNVTIFTMQDVIVGFQSPDGSHGSTSRDGTIKSTETSQGLLALVIMLLLLLVIIVYCCWGTCCRVLRKRRRNGANPQEENGSTATSYPSVVILPYGGMVYRENEGEWHNRSISSDITRTGHVNPRTGKVERITNIPPPSYSSIYGENGTIPPTYSSLDLERLRAWQRSQSQLPARNTSTSLTAVNNVEQTRDLSDNSTLNQPPIFTISDSVTVSVPNTMVQSLTEPSPSAGAASQAKMEPSPRQLSEATPPVANQITRMEKLTRLFTTRKNYGLPRVRSEPAFSLTRHDSKLSVTRVEFPTSNSQKELSS